jgi:hypothetical protein
LLWVDGAPEEVGKGVIHLRVGLALEPLDSLAHSCRRERHSPRHSTRVGMRAAVVVVVACRMRGMPLDLRAHACFKVQHARGHEGCRIAHIANPNPNPIASVDPNAKPDTCRLIARAMEAVQQVRVMKHVNARPLRRRKVGGAERAVAGG